MIGGPVLRQHNIAFVLGTGVTFDGVLNTTSLNGPWTWTVPETVAQLLVTGCGAGSGGIGGSNNNTSSAGGGGGGSGMCLVDFPIDVIPGATLTISLGAGGTGGTQSVVASAGGDTTISGVISAPFTNNGTVFYILGGMGQTTISTTASEQLGLFGGKIVPGSAVSQAMVENTSSYHYFIASSGSAGGAANATGSVAGAAGGNIGNGNRILQWVIYSTPTRAYGNAGGGAGGTTGTKSTGGGGVGGTSLFGMGGIGGGNASGTSQNGGNATGYGGGGGGAGGSGTGGNGSNGYLRITYWSAD